ncbi:MAG TPA: DUF4383 domain-containing protein [Bauldia sp.]|nr:DUF4383 domain-containing protein [Bauldia sp.]
MIEARTAAITAGVVIGVTGAIALFGNPLADGSGEALFHIRIWHALVLIVLGLLLLAGAFTALGSRSALRIVGLAFAAMFVLGVLGDGQWLALLDFISNSAADEWLNGILAVLLLGAGVFLREDEPAAPRPESLPRKPRRIGW